MRSGINVKPFSQARERADRIGSECQMCGDGLIRAVLFDLDGVLVDSYELWFSLMNEVASVLGHPSISRERFKLSWGQSIEDDARAFYPGRTVKEIEDQYRRLLPDHFKHLFVEPDAASTMNALRA